MHVQVAGEEGAFGPRLRVQLQFIGKSGPDCGRSQIAVVKPVFNENRDEKAWLIVSAWCAVAEMAGGGHEGSQQSSGKVSSRGHGGADGFSHPAAKGEVAGLEVFGELVPVRGEDD